ncbi:MAG: hypothetical protein DHS20C18_40880 [Saprospiraceae bacterium]|nr:MAG: hypothetical protein DHS20C18_40880 [Saprospiraceae bacterium]
MKVTNSLFSAVLLTFLTLHLSAQKYPPVKLNVDEPEKLDDYIQHYMAEAGVPGLGLAIVSGDELVYYKGYGVRSMDTREKVDDNTIFAAASLSKPLFAYGVLKLMEAGKIDLDKPLFQYLEYEDLKHDDRYKKITARMVMSHSSGLPNWRRGQLDFSNDPGTQFGYSGEGFVYLMRVVEKITGQNMQDFMQETVLQPLGMTRSSYVWKPDFEANVAIPHDDLGHTYSPSRYDAANSAYSLLTTAVDYSIFIRAILHAKGLKPQTIQAMLKHEISVTKEGDEEHGGLFWGLGLGLQETSDGPAFWHWGDNGMFKCFVIAYPGQKVGMVYFTNSASGLGIAKEIVQGVLGGNYPSIRWLDYSGPELPAFKLLRALAKEDFKVAIRPYLAKNGLHQDTALLNERTTNRMGYNLLTLGKIEAAQEILRMNMLAYPESANVYDSYGEALLRNGQLKEAAEYYGKAAKMDPNNEAAKTIAYQLTEGNKKGNKTFILGAYPNAKQVSLVGSFNGWNRLTYPMVWENGQWIARLDLEPGKYTYQFVVDGVSILDPKNEETEYEGGRHRSVMEVKE